MKKGWTDRHLNDVWNDVGLDKRQLDKCRIRQMLYFQPQVGQTSGRTVGQTVGCTFEGRKKTRGIVLGVVRKPRGTYFNSPNEF